MRYIRGVATLMLLLATAGSVVAQDKSKPKTEFTGIRQREGLVRISLTSSRPFIFGSNTYALYIGRQECTRNEQWQTKGRGFMTFFMETDEAAMLQDGADMYLTYGTVNVNEEDMQALSKTSRRCWYLGKYHKTKLTK